LVLVAITGCKIKDDCVTDKKCLEYPPKDELCDAAFERWFYSSKDEKCYKKGYSGCEEYGFKTEAECEKCKYEKDSKGTFK
jgi:hypothetical protein